jgi:hypothetical protein
MFYILLGGSGRRPSGVARQTALATVHEGLLPFIV